MNEYSNLMAEQSILGSVLLEPSILEDIKYLISENDFCYTQNKIIYSAMLEIYNEGKELDIVLLANRIKSKGFLDDIGGITYLTQLTTLIVAVNAYKSHCKIVKDLSSKRKLDLILKNAREGLKEKSIEEVLEELEKAKSISDENNSYLELVTTTKNINNQKKVKILSTGFLKLDRAIAGLPEGTLCIITGKPGTGKTTFLNQVVANNLKHGESCMIYSGEMPERRIKGWLHSTIANEKHIVEYSDQFGELRHGVSPYGAELIDNWLEDKLFIFKDDSKPSMRNIEGTIIALHKKYGTRLVIIDNLMTMLADVPGTDKNERQTVIATRFKKLAKKYGLVIILVAHAKKKDSDKNEDHHDMFDISGASEVPNLADTVLKMLRKKVKDEKTGEILGDNSAIYIAKNREEGEYGISLRTYFDKKRSRFYTDGMNELNVNYGYDENEKFEQVSTEEMPF